MKKILIFLLVCLMLAQNALALNASGYPAYEGTSAGTNALGADIGGTRVLMGFDDTKDYSYITNGVIQACFFAYNAEKTAFVEIYLLVPETVQTGDVITPAYCAEHACGDCSVTFIEAIDSSEDFYTVFSMNGEGYPSGTDYRITIESVSWENGAVTLTGSFSCTLARYNGVNLDGTQLAISEASFSCTVSEHVDSKDLPGATPKTDPQIDPKDSQPSPYGSSVPDISPAATPFAVKV